jgi:hypothetical protein
MIYAVDDSARQGSFLLVLSASPDSYLLHQQYLSDAKNPNG